MNTLAHETRLTTLAGKAAEEAEKKKTEKYKDLTNRYVFIPIGFETFGSFGPAAKSFLAELGRRIALSSDEPRSLDFLRQRVSIAIQRGNAISVLGTCEKSRCLDEVYYLLSTNQARPMGR